MSTLFDVSPEEPVKKRGARAKGRTPSEENSGKAEKAPLYREIAGVAEIIAKIDDHFTCADESCGASSNDIYGEDGGDWLIECAVCGTGQRVRAIKGYIQPKPQEFAFRDGRFAGMTLSETAAAPRGLDYLRWAAASHPRPSVKEAAQTWLASNPAPQ